jgi:hypothetical protein
MELGDYKAGRKELVSNEADINVSTLRSAITIQHKAEEKT